MRVPEQLVEVWAAGTDGRGKCGSGWIVGQSGVFSCRHVLERYLASVDNNANGLKDGDEQARVQIRQASASSASAWVDCSLEWQHPTRDLVLLKITPQPGQVWDSPNKRLSRLAGTGQLPSECVAMGFPDAGAKPVGLRDSEQASGKLLPAGAARDPDGLVPFDVDASVPDAAALWEGFSGSAVIDYQNRLIGLVVKAHPARQERRLLVVPIEDATDDPAFVSAASVVGLNTTVEDYLAPSWRQGVEPGALNASGVPLAIADVTDLKVFGIHDSSAGARGSPIHYVDRDKDPALDAALAEARKGGRRIVMVTGDSAAGKSRSAAEALRRDPILCRWQLVVPLSVSGLSHLAEAGLGWQDTIVWLDNLDKYLVGGLDLSTLRRVLGDDPTVAVVATMRTSQLQARQGQLTDPAWGFLTDASQVTRVDLEAALSDNELQTATAEISDPALVAALQEGTGLGEWLVAGPELMKKLTDGRGLNRAFADIVIAWYRTGLDQPLAREDARRLWTETLPPVLQQRLVRRDTSEQSELFEQVSSWACAPVIDRELYEQALVTKKDSGYAAHDYIVDQIGRNPQRPMVPDLVWEHALQAATSNPDPGQRRTRIWAVGNAAFEEHTLPHAMTAMQTLADAGDEGALFNVGVLFGDLGRLEEAAGVFDQVVARFGNATEPKVRERVAGAMIAKGDTLVDLGRSEEAAGVFDQVVARFGNSTEPKLRERVARAMVRKGAALGGQVWVYDQVVERFGDATEPKLREAVAGALYSKGSALVDLGRSEEAVGVFDQVVERFGDATEPELRERVARAMVSKGAALGRLGRSEEAAGILDEVVERFGDATEPELRGQVAKAMTGKGAALAELGRSEEAAGVLDKVVERFGNVTGPELREPGAGALSGQGAALAGLGRLEEAAGFFDQVVERFGNATEPELREASGRGLGPQGCHARRPGPVGGGGWGFRPGGRAVRRCHRTRTARASGQGHE
jgi:tetratricopeptide (TPR) repeat protein